ncbi:MAG: hypothetical protein WC372_04035 [Candidatus Neomarinimicrobiota bacterium]|jgi:hypothetical protein|nr:hypothetical protein [Candidatus Neomarinimicrobiota bacterium]MDD3965831.1 hypothetical protein [Candidatus Neomarinimicrobiota bacterium]MDX9779704.1 hypothetical protein [bacterium]
MKRFYYFFSVIFVLLLLSCNLFDHSETGTVTFKGVNTIPENVMTKLSQSIASQINAEATHTMYSWNMKFNIHEIWISQETVDTGISDMFTWQKLGVSEGLKYMNEYEMIAEDIPAGEYYSIKIVFRNEVLRIAAYVDDTTKIVEMPSSLSESAASDSSLVLNYFSHNGSFIHNDEGFQLMSAAESIAPFSVNAGRRTTIYWKGGAEDSKWTDFTFQWHDLDGDSLWTTGLDYVNNFEGPEDVPMWTFIIVEE